MSATLTPPRSEAEARVQKAWRIAASVIRSAGHDLALMEACATLIASATDHGARFCDGLWAELRETNPRSVQTRTMVAERIEQHVRLVRAMHRVVG